MGGLELRVIPSTLPGAGLYGPVLGPVIQERFAGNAGKGFSCS